MRQLSSTKKVIMVAVDLSQVARFAIWDLVVGWGRVVGFFQGPGRLEPEKRWVSMVDWDCCRGGFGGSWLVWQCNAGSLQCQSNFLPFRRFCSVTNLFFLSCRNGQQQDKREES